MSTNADTSESTEDKSISCDDNNKTTEDDEELSALLDSALNDFKQSKPKTVSSAADELTKCLGVGDGAATSAPIPTTSDDTKGNTKTEDSFDDNLNTDFAKFDEMFSPLINSDPQLKEHWTKLTQSCADAANATTDEEFQNSLKETLKTISEKAQTVVGQDNNLSEEELAKIWSNLGMNGEEEASGGNSFTNLMPLMTNMMQNLLSKELLYPALSELVEKYPQYLDENKDKLSAEDLKRYTQQMELMREVCTEFDSEKPEDSESTKRERFQRVLAIMQSMQNCGSPPTQLIGDVPDFTTGLPPDLKFPDIPGMSAGDGQSPGQCLIM